MTAPTWPAPFPKPVARPEDVPFWESVQERMMKLQHCDDCGHVRYPAADFCPECLSESATWRPVGGTATLVSWCTFHREYLPAFPPPHTVAVGHLPEGPFFVAFLLDEAPDDGASGSRLEIQYVEDVDGILLPAFRQLPDPITEEAQG